MSFNVSVRVLTSLDYLGYEKYENIKKYKNMKIWNYENIKILKY